jgi:hypothetical protein
MSGGSLGYAYGKVEDAAYNLGRQARSHLDRAFADHLMKVAKALRAVEWTLSGDSDDDSADAAIRSVITPIQELDSAVSEAESALENLRACIERARRIK